MRETIAREVEWHLKENGAFWLYQGKARREAPHALLTSGKHSDGYINVGEVLRNRQDICMRFADFIFATILDEWKGEFDYVVGADTSSTNLARDVARLAKVKHIRMEKVEEENGQKKQAWHTDNLPFEGDGTILQVEDLITTSLSSKEVREGIRRANPGMNITFAPFLVTVVDRSDPGKRVTTVENSKVLPLLQLSIRNYNPDNCPYCKAGSEAIKPKFGDNWSKLTGV